MAFQQLGLETFEFVTSVTPNFSLLSRNGAIGSEATDPNASPRHNTGLNSAGERRAYSVNSSDQLRSLSVFNTDYNHAARETALSFLTTQFGTAQYMPPQPPPTLAAAQYMPLIRSVGVGPATAVQEVC